MALERSGRNQREKRKISTITKLAAKRIRGKREMVVVVEEADQSLAPCSAGVK